MKRAASSASRSSPPKRCAQPSISSTSPSGGSISTIGVKRCAMSARPRHERRLALRIVSQVTRIRTRARASAKGHARLQPQRQRTLVQRMQAEGAALLHGEDER